MPELPEVETTRRGIEPHLRNKTIVSVLVHDKRLRWPVPNAVQKLAGERVHSVERRGKYILINTQVGSALVHLGMSGSLRICTANDPLKKHDHVEVIMSSGQILRLHDPRRFGCFLWQAADAAEHKLLASLGPEPLTDAFNADYLFARTRKRQLAIKNLIMNSDVVVGVGNIYASESLFLAGIRPGRAAKRVTRKETTLLVETIKTVLARSIKQGGTTLRDFVDSDGNPGYFKQSLHVYGREGEACTECGNTIRQRVIGQRSTFYCTQCQH